MYSENIEEELITSISYHFLQISDPQWVHEGCCSSLSLKFWLALRYVSHYAYQNFYLTYRPTNIYLILVIHFPNRLFPPINSIQHE